MDVAEKPTLEKFTDDEIKAEYVERFGAPDADIGDFDDDEIRGEYEHRFGEDDGDGPDGEVIELIAEAARASPHAKRAYEMLRECWPHIHRLDVAQLLISGRMGEAA